MPQSDAKRLLPIIAKAFADLGYRGATTATLARHCGVRENILYRVWPSKKEMFLATIDFIWERSRFLWEEVLRGANPSDASSATRLLLEYESKPRSGLQLHRVVFAGLTELDDPDIAAAMRRMYQNFHAFIAAQIAGDPEPIRAKRSSGRKKKGSHQTMEDELAAWGLVALGTVVSIGQSLDLIDQRTRSLLYTRVGNLLIQDRKRLKRPASQ
jgi:AcrR family transcriptional regulator